MSPQRLVPHVALAAVNSSFLQGSNLLGQAPGEQASSGLLRYIFWGAFALCLVNSSKWGS